MNLYIALTQFWKIDPERDIVHFDGKNWSYKTLEAAIWCVVDFLQKNNSDNPNSLIYIDAKSNWARLVAILACIHQARLFITDCPAQSPSIYKIILKLSDDGFRRHEDIPVYYISRPERISLNDSSSALNPKAYQTENSWLRLAATSGTTGIPKWVPISVGDQLNRIWESKERMGPLDNEANMFLCGASAWFARFFGGAANGTLTCIETDAKKTLDFLKHHPASTVYSSPDQLVYLLRAVREDTNFKANLKSVTVCGGALTPSAAKAVRQYLGAHSVSQYASTECGHTAQADFEMTEHGHCLVGRISSHVQVRITDERGTPLSRMQEGVVNVKSDYMATGYLDLQTGSMQPFQEAWFDSGDMGYLTNDHQLILTGRKSDVVNIRGNKVNLQKVDSFFSEIPGVLDAAGFLMQGELGYPDVWVAVVLEKTIETDGLQKKSLDQLGYILAPSQMIQVRSIPRTAAGKVKRHEITTLLEKALAIKNTPS